MEQREFNKEISNYIQERRQSEEKIKDVESIKKQAESKSVEETHPSLEEGKVHVIEKEKSWIKNVFSKGRQPVKQEPSEAEESEFEAEEAKIKGSKRSVWKRFAGWIKREDEVPVPERFEESMEKIEKEEEELKEEDAEIEEEERELHKERSNIIMSFVSRFRPQRKISALQEQIFDLEEDLKAIAKITTSVMRQLPPEKLQSYKNSKEFETFKEILKKRNLIKETEKQQ